MRALGLAASWFVCCLAAANGHADPSAMGGRTVTDVTVEDLMAIVDLGVADLQRSDGVAVSPNERSVAIEARTADWRRNRIHIRWLVVPLDPSGPVLDVGDGGQPIATKFDGVSTGYSAPQLPLWSSDSQWIVYRAQVDGQVQLWRSRVDGSIQERLTSNEADVESFRWCERGNRLLFFVSSPRKRIAEALREEGTRGYLYDERFDQLNTARAAPAVAELVDAQGSAWTYDFDTREERPAAAGSDCEGEQPIGSGVARLHSRVQFPSAVLVVAKGERGFGLEPMRTLAIARTKDLVVECKSPLCTGRFAGSWLSADASTVYGLRWAGKFNYGRMTLVSWQIKTGQVRSIFGTEDLLEGCSRAGSVLVCGQASATHPAVLTTVDLTNGARRTIYDPNSGLRGKRFGEVTPFEWVDAEGVEGFGHVVKPPQYREGSRYPLVVVQYRSAGFLRGGVGDEYPVHVLAAQGFVVLSFSRPDEWPLLVNSKSYDEVKQKGWRGFYDRRRVLSVLEAGIDRLVQAGLVDPERIGITGLSDGAETLGFALVHSPSRFAAAAVSGTFWSPIAYYVAGPRLQPLLERWGFEEPMNGSQQQWRGMSLALNAATVETPLLVQVSDAEMLPDTQTVASLSARGKPVEMYVFPDEFHIKSQPVHRYAIYVRNVQWFKFWLQGIEETDPLDPRQYERWRNMRTRQREAALSQR